MPPQLCKRELPCGPPDSRLIRPRLLDVINYSHLCRNYHWFQKQTQLIDDRPVKRVFGLFRMCSYPRVRRCPELQCECIEAIEVGLVDHRVPQEKLQAASQGVNSTWSAMYCSVRSEFRCIAHAVGISWISSRLMKFRPAFRDNKVIGCNFSR